MSACPLASGIRADGRNDLLVGGGDVGVLAVPVGVGDRLVVRWPFGRGDVAQLAEARRLNRLQ